MCVCVSAKERKGRARNAVGVREERREKKIRDLLWLLGKGTPPDAAHFNGRRKKTKGRDELDDRPLLLRSLARASASSRSFRDQARALNEFFLVVYLERAEGGSIRGLSRAFRFTIESRQLTIDEEERKRSVFIF